MNTKYPILQTSETKSLNVFVTHWRQLYSYSNELQYSKNIIVKEFTKENLIELFHWKNGMTLVGSGTKEKALKDKILKRIRLINQYKSNSKIDESKFNNDFKDVSAVWRIFLLHLIKPNIYPIYDQHIHRTYNFIHGLEWAHITNTINNKVKLNFYFETYLPYIKKAGFNDLKALDEAFFAFGQYLNTRNQSKLLINE